MSCVAWPLQDEEATTLTQQYRKRKKQNLPQEVVTTKAKLDVSAQARLQGLPWEHQQDRPVQPNQP